jgi:hypothetical protein
MYQRYYYVRKESGTLTDTLLAFGLAQMLEDIVTQIQGEDNAQIVLEDKGGYFQIDAGTTIQEVWLPHLQPWDRLPYALGGRKITAPPSQAPDIAIRDVNKEWDDFRRYNEQRKALNEKKVVGQELANALDDLRPRPDWTVLTFLTDFRMQVQGINNKLALQWHLSSQEYLALNVRTILGMFASMNAPVDELTNAWRKETGKTFPHLITASQVFNPHMGKGQNRPKANKLTMDNEKKFWIEEYLKAVGLWLAAAPRNVRNGNFRKTYVLAPRHMALRDHKRVFRRFLENLWDDTAIKMDIIASLLYTHTLLDFVAKGDDLGLFQARRISRLVSGMNVATYQLLSANAYTMMNLAFLGLPDWMPQIQSRSDVRMFQDILQEHQQRIRSIEEGHSEGYNLLRRYRDFLSGGDFNAFFDFLADYGSFLISELDRSHFYTKPFSETHLRRLIQMSQPKLASILQTRGFQNIAEAIRRSTVIPQYIGRQQSQYDIRYGLGQELKRKAQYPDEFIQALADFMHSYNEENARVYERTKGKGFRRKAITTQDIEEVVALVDEYGSQTVANLLIAFGYARDPKENADDASPQS